MITFTVPGNPLSLNHAYPTGRNGRRYHSPEGKAWARSVALAATLAKKGAAPLEGDVRVVIVAHFSSRRPDLDNAIKPILDGLSGVLWGDDRQVVEIVARKGLDKAHPRVEVSVDPVGGGGR